ncbi:MAG TPA: YdcF family protein, partial [Hymenobacter sp.]
MFFLLSKFLYYVVMPATWLVGLLMAALLTRNPVRRKRFVIAALLVTIVSTNGPLANLALLAWELPPVPLRNIAPHDAGILLTGLANTHKSPHDRVYISSAADRITHTLWLYRAHRIRRIIVSGGSGDLTQRVHTEAEEVNTLLRLAGVPQADILLEDRSRNTRENALFTKELLAHHPEIK